MDRTSTPDRRSPVGRPGVIWGLGDFASVYFGGIVAGSLYDADPHLPMLVTVALALPVAFVFAIVVSRITRAELPRLV